MSLDKLSYRYATALYQEAVAQQSLDSTLKDVNGLIELLNNNEDLVQMLKNPVVGIETKKSIVKQIFSNKISPLIFNFLNLVIEHRRESGLQAILNKFIALYNENHGIAKVELILAAEIDQSTQQKLEDFIKQQSGKPKVTINKKIDASILGGFIINFGDRIYDNSVKQRLQKIKNNLILN